jgi:hypothetical protein
LKPLFFKNKEIGCTKEAVKYFNNRFYHENTKHLHCIVPDKIAKDQCGMNLETILENEEKIFAPSIFAAYDLNFLKIPFVEIEILRINTLLTTPKTTVNNLNFVRLLKEIEIKVSKVTTLHHCIILFSNVSLFYAMQRHNVVAIGKPNSCSS